jgi:opacity protein-like surface antigen
LPTESGGITAIPLIQTPERGDNTRSMQRRNLTARPAGPIRGGDNVRWKHALLFVALIALLSATSAMAQPNKPWKWIYPHVAGGVVMTQGEAGDSLDDGWNLSGGVTFKKENWPVAFQLDLGWNDTDIKDSALFAEDEEGDPVRIADNGDVTVWSITADVQWGSKNEGRTGFYVLGGLGTYYIQGKLTNSVWVPGWICDWYWCYPGMWPADSVIGSASSWEWGYNAGVGFNFNLNSDSQIYIEAKYHWIQSDTTGEYVPIVIGFRW